MPKIKGDRNEDLVHRHGAPIRTQEDILRRVFVPRLHPLNAPDVEFDALPNVCVVVNVEWVSHVIGVLEALNQDDSWLGDDTERDRAQGEAQKLIVSFMNGGACMIDPCCPEDGEKLQILVDATTTVINNQNTLITNSDTLIEYNQTQIIQNFISTHNNNVNNNAQTAITNNYVYNGTPQSIDEDIPDEPFGTGTIGKNALCYACTKYLEQVLYAASVGLALSSLATSAVAAVAAIALGIALAPITAGASIVAGFSIGATIMIGAGTAVIASIISNTQAQRKVVCCMYHNLKELPITEANFRAVAQDCGDMDDDENAQTLASWVDHASQNEGNYLAFLRMLGEAQGQGNWRNCDCCKEIEDYEIISLNSAVITKLTDFTYRIVQTEVDEIVVEPFCTDGWKNYVAIFQETEGRCIDIINGSGTAAYDHYQLDCEGQVVQGTGGGGGSGTYFKFRTRACGADPTTMDITITIACPTLHIVPE